MECPNPNVCKANKSRQPNEYLSGRSVDGFQHLLRQFRQVMITKNTNAQCILPVGLGGWALIKNYKVGHYEFFLVLPSILFGMNQGTLDSPKSVEGQRELLSTSYRYFAERRALGPFLLCLYLIVHPKGPIECDRIGFGTNYFEIFCSQPPPPL